MPASGAAHTGCWPGPPRAGRAEEAVARYAAVAESRLPSPASASAGAATWATSRPTSPPGSGTTRATSRRRWPGSMPSFAADPARRGPTTPAGSRPGRPSGPVTGGAPWPGWRGSSGAAGRRRPLLVRPARRRLALRAGAAAAGGPARRRRLVRLAGAAAAGAARPRPVRGATGRSGTGGRLRAAGRAARGRSAARGCHPGAPAAGGRPAGPGVARRRSADARGPGPAGARRTTAQEICRLATLAGEPALALRVARDLLGAGRQSDRWLYPVAFQELVAARRAAPASTSRCCSRWCGASRASAPRRSSAGAQGLGQLLPVTASRLGLMTRLGGDPAARLGDPATNLPSRRSTSACSATGSGATPAPWPPTTPAPGRRPDGAPGTRASPSTSGWRTSPSRRRAST